MLLRKFDLVVYLRRIFILICFCVLQHDIRLQARITVNFNTWVLVVLAKVQKTTRTLYLSLFCRMTAREKNRKKRKSHQKQKEHSSVSNFYIN